MDTSSYTDLFRRTENTLRKESALSEEAFDLVFGRFKNLSYEKMSDEEIFWTIVYVTFYSGMRASVVSKRLPAIKEYLYDFTKVKHYTETEIDAILNDPQTIHNRRKVEACVANAREFDKLTSEYGHFRKYLVSFGDLKNDRDIDRLRLDLRDRFQYLGERTVNHFLTDLGLNVLKPDRVICRVFARLGLIRSPRDLAGAIEVGRQFAAATGYAIRYVDIIFVKYGQAGEDPGFGISNGICLEAKPRCEVCGVTRYCKYYASRR